MLTVFRENRSGAFSIPISRNNSIGLFNHNLVQQQLTA